MILFPGMISFVILILLYDVFIMFISLKYFGHIIIWLNTPAITIPDNRIEIKLGI
jgi:hypothetical protein